jgi:O-antigen/teichoic acid export membrane protein
VTSTLLPLQARESASGTSAIARIQGQALCLLQIFLLPVCACAALVARPLISVLYGDAYLQVWPVFVVLLISPFAIGLTDVSVASIYAMDRQRSLVLPLTMTAVLNLFLAYLLVPRWGAVGAAAANSSAQLAEATFLLLFSSSILSTRIPWTRLSKIYALALVCFAPAGILVYYKLSIVPLGIILTVGSIAYFFFLWKSGELTFTVSSEVRHADA